MQKQLPAQAVSVTNWPIVRFRKGRERYVEIAEVPIEERIRGWSRYVSLHIETPQRNCSMGARTDQNK